MTRIVTIAAMLLCLVLLVVASCDKERIVDSKEYIHDTQYIQLPPDTVWQRDTIRIADSVVVHDVDTVVQVNTVHDTVRITSIIHDTVVTVHNFFDTIIVRDTVVKTQCSPTLATAINALQYHTNPLVFELVQSEFGLTDGWVYYLTTFQVDAVPASSTVFDIYGYLDYWAQDFSGYYPIEYFWRVTYLGGDPSNPSNWQMTEPPASAPERQPGVKAIAKTPTAIQMAR